MHRQQFDFENVYFLSGDSSFLLESKTILGFEDLLSKLTSISVELSQLIAHIRHVLFACQQKTNSIHVIPIVSHFALPITKHTSPTFRAQSQAH